MASFDKHSTAVLAMAHADIQRVMNLAIAHAPVAFAVLESYRSPAAQLNDYQLGRSHAKPGESAHNFLPSLAVDIAPLPIDWHNTQAFVDLSTYIMSVADICKVALAWGGKWHTIIDMPHYELTDWRFLAAKITANEAYDGGRTEIVQSL
jgi:hypothetical protein